MTERKYFPQYDTLRLLSILAIILYHYITHRVTGGFLAVDVFFILSGFLTTQQLEKQYQAGTFQPLAASLHKRWQTIFWPMLFVILCGVTVLVIFRRDLLVNIGPNIFSSLFFVNNWYQIVTGSSYFAEMMHPSLFTHLWYISVYFQFIIIWQILFRSSRRYFKTVTQSGLAALGMALISAVLMGILFTPGEDPSRVYYGTDTRFFSFAIGSAAAQLFTINALEKYCGKWTATLSNILLLLALSGTIGLILKLQDAAAVTYYGGMVLFDILVAVIICMVTVPRSILGKLLSFKPTAWLGKRSYPMYLWYYPIYILLHVSGNQSGLFAFNVYFQVLLIFTLAILTYLLVIQRKWWVPIFVRFRGEPLRLLTGLEQVRSPQTALSSKILFGFFTIITLSGLISPALSTSAETQTVQEQEAAEQQARLRSMNSERAAEEQEVKADLEAYKKSLDEQQLQYYAQLTEAEARFAFNLQPTFIGDSLMLGASEALYTLYPQAIIDAEVGRQVYKVQPVLDALVSSGQIKNPVVVSLGANGGFSEQNIQDMVTTIGEDKVIFFVNTHVQRPWRNEVNTVLANITTNPDDNIYLIDWASHYNGRTELLRDDKVHLSEAGIIDWTSFITAEVNKNMPK